MKEGSTQRFDCDDCNVEFEVTLEPKMKGSKPAKDGPVVEMCPFCGSCFVTTDEDEEEEDDE